VAAQCHANTRDLVGALTSIRGVSATLSPFFHEAVLTLPQPVAPLLQQLAAAGILGGYDLSTDFPELGHALLVCATELRTTEDIAAYRHALASVLGVAVAA
jgi:glycine dehydrogenase subunit 1